jgi:hypothetical protein
MNKDKENDKTPDFEDTVKLIEYHLKELEEEIVHTSLTEKQVCILIGKISSVTQWVIKHQSKKKAKKV